MKKPKVRPGSHINVKWFNEALSAADKSQADLARLLSLSPSQISKLFAGERRVQIYEVPELASFLGKTNAEVLTNLGIRLEEGGQSGPVATGDIPVVGHIMADGTATIDLDHPERTTPAPANVPAGTVAISGSNGGHSGSALLTGGLFFVRMTDRLEASAVGRLSLVRLQKGPWLLRTIRPATEVGRYDLIGPAGVMENQEIVVGSPVLLIKP